MTNKQNALTQMAEEWRRFLEVARGLSDEEQVLPGVVGSWSVKEVLIHIAAGDLDVVKEMEADQKTGDGKTISDYGPEMDSLNEAWVAERRGLPLLEIWEYLYQSHRELLKFLDPLPDSAYDPDTYIDHWITVFSDHYREHREHLEQWGRSRS